MSIDPDIPLLLRPAYFDGQALVADDLTAGQDFHRVLRWLHNQSLHNWGVALGLVVTGAKGTMSVHVEPGFAVDALGRELIVVEPIDLPIPSSMGGPGGQPATYLLTASYAADSQATELRSGECGTSGAVRLLDTPVVRWQDPNSTEPSGIYRPGVDVVLATIAVKNCKLASDASAAGRRDARPAKEPYVGAGQASPAPGDWSPWPAPNPLGLQVPVNTLAARFGATPNYQALLVGERYFSGTIAKAAMRFVLDGPIQITGASASGFTLVVLLPTGMTVGQGNPVPLNTDWVLTNAVDRQELMGKLGWVVSWIGVES